MKTVYLNDHISPNAVKRLKVPGILFCPQIRLTADPQEAVHQSL